MLLSPNHHCGKKIDAALLTVPLLVTTNWQHTGNTRTGVSLTTYAPSRPIRGESHEHRKHAERKCSKFEVILVVSDQFKPVYARTVWLPLTRRKDHATRGESGAVGPEVGSAGKAAFLIEVVCDRGMDGCEHLTTPHAPEPMY